MSGYLLWLWLPPTANLDEIITLGLTLVGLTLASWALRLRLRDSRYVRSRTAVIVARGRAINNALIVGAHLVLLTQAIRLTQVRPPTQTGWTLLSIYLLPLIPLALIGATLVDLYVRRQVARADVTSPRPFH